ncbi:MAG: hypothetical protein LC772_01875, partial [Chloroflexi bacterium]|nr:hypothetical protein [Chloroflexota bacterium]
GILVATRTHGDISKASGAVDLSIYGIISGLVQNAYHVTVHMEGFHRRRLVMQSVDIHPPNLWIMLAAAAVLCVGGIAAARVRIRAVEVVRG